jgi:hypothetical protein
MQRRPYHIPILSGFFALLFLFSANVLFVGTHAAEELVREAARLAAVGAATHAHNGLPGDCAHHGEADSAHSHSGGDCCDTHNPHSHDFRGETLPTVGAANMAPLRFFEHPASHSEVFLERFIPPPNHA